jgi:hypothetical protein
MSLPRPPDGWLEANGVPPRDWWTLSEGRRADACAKYEYEQRNGRPPPPNFAEGTTAFDQWTYRRGDPLEVLA